MRKLTDRQVVVLAAVERLGSPTPDDLRQEVSALTASETSRVVNALVTRGLVAESGRPVRFSAVPRETREGRRDSVSASD